MIGVAIAALFGGGASALSRGQRKRELIELGKEVEKVVNDPYRFPVKQVEYDNRRMSIAESTTRNGFLDLITLGLSTACGNNYGKSEQQALDKQISKVMELAGADMPKGSLYYLLLKSMDIWTGTQTRTDVAMFLANQPKAVKDEMIGFLSGGRPATDTDLEHSSFYRKLKELGENDVAYGNKQYGNAREFMLACLKGEQPLAAVQTPAAAASVKQAAEPSRHVRRERAKINDTQEKTVRYGNYSPHSSWYRDMTTTAAF